MEFEEEPISHLSGETRSPSPPPPPPSNGRITVTIAAPPLERGVTLALPIQQHRPIGANYPTGVVTGVVAGVGGGGGGREDCWSEGATEVLIEAWGERYVELKRGNLRQNHWKEVADIVSSRDEYSKTPKTDNQCKNRIDTVKKKFKTEKQRIGLSGGRSNWRFFDRIEELIGPLPLPRPQSTPSVGVFATGFEGQDVPLGIPVGARPRPMQDIPQFRQPETLKRKMGPGSGSGDYERRKKMERGFLNDEGMNSGSGEYERRKKMERGFLNDEGVDGNGNGGRRRSWGESVRELSMAIVRLGEAYQEAESMKLQQWVEMEKKRMSFAKELELQRMRFMTETQMEISHMKGKLKEQERHRK